MSHFLYLNQVIHFLPDRIELRESSHTFILPTLQMTFMLGKLGLLCHFNQLV